MADKTDAAYQFAFVDNLPSGIFFGVLRGRNSAPFPMGFR